MALWLLPTADAAACSCARFEVGACNPTGQSSPRTAPRREPGWLGIHTIPVARVFLDGEDTGLMTPVRRLEVAPGPHVLRLVPVNGARPVTVEVVVEAGRQTTIYRQLE
ncbi:MAG: PEGA domain-containing protein [Myxococcales bacterium]|nr:PEGA domain-containing protein [Myxococcales bacterium]